MYGSRAASSSIRRLRSCSGAHIQAPASNMHGPPEGLYESNSQRFLVFVWDIACTAKSASRHRAYDCQIQIIIKPKEWKNGPLDLGTYPPKAFPVLKGESGRGSGNKPGGLDPHHNAMPSSLQRPQRQ